jgi:hypothetical protein
MLKRAIALSLALIIGIGTIIPIATEYAEAGPKKSKRYKKKQKRGWRGVKKYSKRWWQLYRAQERRKKQLAKRRRALRLKRLRLAKLRRAKQHRTSAKKVNAKPAPSSSSSAPVLPSGQAAPKGWRAGSLTSGELQFRIDNGSGTEIGSASISVVGPAMGETTSNGRNMWLAGVPTTSLRREVINRMIRENGWVVNDYQKDLGGRSVYVVVAQSQGAGGRINARMFYFAEADGRIYSVATNANADSAERLAEESEKVIFSLQNRQRPVQQASSTKE